MGKERRAGNKMATDKHGQFVQITLKGWGGEGLPQVFVQEKVM